MTALNSRNTRTARPTPRFDIQNFQTAPRTLKQAVDAAVCLVNEDALQSPATQSRALLALVTHCYARQIYSSVQLTGIARCDADFSDCSAGNFPDAQSIRRFRADHREAIHRCLTAALRFLADEKIALGEFTKVSDAQLDQEASRRIIMAAFMDNLELDAQPVPESPAELSYLFAKPPPPVH